MSLIILKLIVETYLTPEPDVCKSWHRNGIGRLLHVISLICKELYDYCKNKTVTIKTSGVIVFESPLTSHNNNNDFACTISDAWIETTYLISNGKRHGKMRAWTNKDKRFLLRFQQYDRGVRIGTRQELWPATTKLRMTVTFDGDSGDYLLTKLYRSDDNNTLQFQIEHNRDIQRLTVFDEDGVTVLKTAQYVNGKLNGPVFFYYTMQHNNRLKCKQMAHNDRFEGPYELYHPNGQLAEIGEILAVSGLKNVITRWDVHGNELPMIVQFHH